MRNCGPGKLRAADQENYVNCALEKLGKYGHKKLRALEKLYTLQTREIART